MVNFVLCTLKRGPSLRFFTLCLALSLTGACTKGPPPARAFQIDSRAELFGGKRALADVEAASDATDLIGGKRASGARATSSSPTASSTPSSRTWAPAAASAASGLASSTWTWCGGGGEPHFGVPGNDYFTEMFPAFFLTALEPAKVEVFQTAATAPRAIRVSGRSGSFFPWSRPSPSWSTPRTHSTSPATTSWSRASST